MEAFTTKGHWWLPGNSDRKVKGELIFDPGGGSILELSDVLKIVKVIRLGTFTGTEPIILGEDDDGQAITLVECSEQPPHIDRSDSDAPSGVLAYRTPLIVLGYRFDREEDIAFSRLTVDYYGLQIWADPSRRAGKIRPVPIPDDASAMDDVLVHAGDFSVRIRRNIPQENHHEVESVKQYALIDFLSDKPRGFGSFLEILFCFQAFLSLAMRIPTWPMMVKAPHPKDESRQISIHYRPVTEFRKVNGQSSSFMHFTLEDSLPYLENGLRRWFSKFDNLYRVLQMYNRAISLKMFIEEQFMMFARAVEVYHRRQIHAELYIEESRYEEICEALKETLKSHAPPGKNDRFEDLERSIHSSLKYANRPSLRRRLKDIGERYSACNERLFENYKDFVDDVVNTRNYLTHFDEKDRKRARLEFRELYSMRERLRVILEICLLSELGLNESQIQHIIFGSAASVPM